jgi:dUTP pyrophosphatase
MTVTLKVKKLYNNIELPKFATEGSAAFDIKAATHHVLAPGDHTLVKTGLAFEVPDGYALLVFSRSGHGAKNEVRLSNCVGVIDSDYRGELMIAMKDDRNVLYEGEEFFVNAGDRVAQGILIPIPKVELVEVEELSSTVRGTGGFGSTGQ